jgi:hypothetical protein
MAVEVQANFPFYLACACGLNGNDASTLMLCDEVTVMVQKRKEDSIILKKEKNEKKNKPGTTRYFRLN